LAHVSGSELIFGIEGIEPRDFLFSVNFHSATFSLLEVEEETSLIFAPGRNARDLGTVFAIDLLGEDPREVKARVVLAELFPAKFIDVKPKS
jgi:hypothetical protein